MANETHTLNIGGTTYPIYSEGFKTNSTTTNSTYPIVFSKEISSASSFCKPYTAGALSYNPNTNTLLCGVLNVSNILANGTAGSNGKVLKHNGTNIVWSDDNNTDTKVTSADNHYSPSENSGSALSASGGTLTDIANSSSGVQVVTGLKRDAKGHVVGVNSVALKATNNTYTIPTVNNGTYSIKTLVGSTSTTVSDFTANQSSTDDVTFVQGSNITLTPDKTNRKITIAATNTDTKVTSVGNHYTPAEDTAAQLSVDASSTTAATWNSTSLVTGVNIKRDAKGHVTGISVDSIKMPAQPTFTEQYKGTVTGVKINGTTKSPSSGVVDLGTVITSHQDISGKQDKLVSGTNIKTINNTSILGSGNISISANTSDCVKLSGDQSINGTKTFNDTIVANTIQLGEGDLSFESASSYLYWNHNFAAEGSISATGGFFDTSDERLKNFGDKITVDFEKLKQLKKSYFTWKNKENSDVEIGVSAQELQELYPELVHTNAAGYLSVAYNKLSIVALTAVDELYDENVNLKNKLASLEERLEKLEQLIK